MKVKLKEARLWLKTFRITLLYLTVLWTVCLLPIPETPLSHVRLIDKWTHLVLFGGLSGLIWCEYAYRHRILPARPLTVYSFVIPTVTGGAVEVVQHYCTAGMRSGDPIDFLADVIGTVLGLFIGIPAARYLSNRNTDGAADANYKSGGHPSPPVR